MSAAEKLMLVQLTTEQLTALVRAAIREELHERETGAMLDIEAAAAFLGISPNALRKRVERGAIVPDQPAGDGRKGHRFSRDTLRKHRGE